MSSRIRGIGRAQRGQTVVIVAVALVVLLAFAGLAIDGGTAYLNRRRMQNASDAGSLAGTRLLAEAICGAGHTDADIAQAVLDYAVQNGVDGASGVEAHYVRFQDNNVAGFSPPVAVGGGSIPNGAVGVSVTATITRPTYLLGVVGQSTGSASGYAVAVSGPPRALGGLRPFGVPEEVVTALDPEDDFTLDFKNCQDDECPIEDEEGEEISQHRGWLNLAYVWNRDDNVGCPPYCYWPPRAPKGGDSAGASALDYWMEHGWDGVLYADCQWSDGCRHGDFIHAKPGTNSAVIGTGDDLAAGDGASDVIYIPVFDVTRDCPTQIPGARPVCPKQGSSYVYHVVGFAGVRILDDGTDQGDGKITLELVETFLGAGQVSPNAGYQSSGGSPACLLHMLVITLWQ